MPKVILEYLVYRFSIHSLCLWVETTNCTLLECNCFRSCSNTKPKLFWRYLPGHKVLRVDTKIFGVGFKLTVVDPMIKHGVLPLAIATMALSIIMKEGAKDGFSAEAQNFPSFVPTQTIEVFGAAISLQHLAIIACAFAVIGLLQWFVGGTRLGRQMQATAQNPTVARILGIPVERMVLLTFVINAALAVVASVLISPIYLAKFSNGEVIGLFAFIAAIVGGFNQVRGALVGGLIVGVVDSMAAAYVSSSYRLAVPLVLLVVIILLKPEGLMGRKEERRV